MRQMIIFHFYSHSCFCSFHTTHYSFVDKCDIIKPLCNYIKLKIVKINENYFIDIFLLILHEYIEVIAVGSHENNLYKLPSINIADQFLLDPIVYILILSQRPYRNSSVRRNKSKLQDKPSLGSGEAGLSGYCIIADMGGEGDGEQGPQRAVSHIQPHCGG